MQIVCIFDADRMHIIYKNSYAGKIWVSEIIPSGAAEKNGQIRVGDILLDVDDVRHLTLPYRHRSTLIRPKTGQLGLVRKQK